MERPDYNNKEYDYVRYWDGRDYENASEIIALKKLLPPNGKRVLDAGGGFGRLLPIYKDRFQEIVILDQSSKLLSHAREYAGRLSAPVLTQEGDIYQLSKYNLGKFDCVVMVRVAHHLEDLNKAIGEISRVLTPNGALILEFANKMHLKSVVRHALAIDSNYFKTDPINRASRDVTFLNFHPLYVKNILSANSFRIEQKLSVSNFRIDFLKRLAPISLLATVEGLLQSPLGYINFGPSIFLKCVKIET